MCHYLANKGPTLDLNTVTDISRILRRECPSEREITESSKSIQTRDDNLWALNGEEAAETVQTRWDNTNESTITRHKRRKLQDECFDEKLSDRNNQHDLASIKRVALIGASTTMQNSSTFSYQGSNGFTTATAQLSQIAKAKQDNQSTRVTRRDQKNYEGAARGYQHSGREQFKSSTIPESQGKLLSFWAISNHPKSISNDKDTPQTLMKPVERKNLSKNIASSEPDDSSKAAPTTVAALRGNPLDPYSKKPLAIIPQGLAGHKLIPAAKFGRPHPSLLEDEHTSKQYVFLSSSPPPFQESGEEDANARSDNPSQGTKITFETVGLETATQENSFRPAKTLHTTSIAATKSDTARRTLGVRRSMNGWQSRGNQPFSVPRKHDKGI